MMKNHRVLLVLALSITFLLMSSASVLMAGNKSADTKSTACCPKDQQKMCCPAGDKANCDPAQCKPSDKCDPAKCKPSDKCDPSQCTTSTKTSTTSGSACCPHSKGKVKEDPGT